jgi:hypothetical protein
LQAVREQFSDLDLGGDSSGQQEDSNNGGNNGGTPEPDYNGIGSFSLADMLEVIFTILIFLVDFLEYLL